MKIERVTHLCHITGVFVGSSGGGPNSLLFYEQEQGRGGRTSVYRRVGRRFLLREGGIHPYWELVPGITRHSTSV